MRPKTVTTKAILQAMCARFENRFSFVVDGCVAASTTTGDTLRGLLVDRTSTKNGIRVLTIALPWFHPSERIALNFGYEIGDSPFFRGEADEIAQQVWSAVHADPDAANFVFGPMTALSLARWKLSRLGNLVHAPRNVVFDIAALLALGGETKQAVDILTVLLEYWESCRDERFYVMGEQVLAALRRSGDIRAVLDPVAAANRIAWRIGPLRPKRRHNPTG